MKISNYKKNYQKACAMLFMLFCLSCSQEEVEPYSGIESGIFIQQVATTDVYGNPYSYRDSVAYSFAGAASNVESAVVSVFVQTTGGPKNYDRSYVLEVMDGTTGVEGIDFTLADNDFVVKAHQVADTVRLRLIRTATLRKKTLRLKVGLKANEYFELPFEHYKNSSSWSVDGPQNSATTYVVNYSEAYSEPFYWMFFGDDYFGRFSSARFLALLEVMGWTTTDWNNAGMSGAKVAFGKFDYAARALQKYLQEMADAGTPVYDDDGTLMQLPATYAVDYSKITAN